MITTNPSTTSTSSTTSPRRTPRLALIAGSTYVGAWLLGLAFGPASPDANAAASEVHRFYREHGTASLAQSALVHGVAALALAALTVLGGRAVRGRTGRIAAVTGLAACAVSTVQLGIAAVASRPTSTASRSLDLFHAINTADTVKLCLLAAFVGSLSAPLARVGGGQWPARLAVPLAPLLVAGGLAFVIDSEVLTVALEVSLLLLLTWAVVAAVAVDRIRR